MPDPISLPNAPLAGNYDLEANACVAAPPAAPPVAPPPTVQIFLPEVVIGAGAQQLVDAYAQGAAASSGEAAKPSDCGPDATRAAITCGQMAGAMIVSAPTVLGAAVTGFFGGLACGLAAAEAYDCYSKKP